MGSKPEPEEPTQETEQGYTIPVPKKADVLRDFKKVVEPSRPSGPEDEQEELGSS